MPFAPLAKRRAFIQGNLGLPHELRCGLVRQGSVTEIQPHQVGGLGVGG